jgi:YHS domain-containing protein
MKRFTIPLVAAMAVGVGVAAWGAAPREKAAKKAEPFYGNPVCVITGEKVITGGKVNPTLFVDYADSKTNTYGKIYMCCPMCKEKIEKDPAGAYKKAYLDREIKDKEGKVVVAKGQPIPLNNRICPVMGGKVDGKSHLIYNGYRVDFCCPACIKTFMKDPDKNLSKMIEQQHLMVPGREQPPQEASRQK